MTESQRMPDRERVILALECMAGKKRSCEGCPYSIPVTPDLGGFSYGYCAKGNAAEDAIALLGEEPVKPIAEGERPYRWFRCGNCEEPFYGLWNYCPKCGRKVKWDA